MSIWIEEIRVRVRNIHTGIVCEKSKDMLSVLPDMYEPVDGDTPVTRPKCCGADDIIDVDNTNDQED